MADENTSRRSFLGKLLAGTLFSGVVAAWGAALAYLFSPTGSASDSRKVRLGKAEDLPLGRGRLLLVEGEAAWVVHLAQGFVALSAVCTHKGCVVRWDEKRRAFVCPCHEGMFDEHGNVIFGLPRRPLTRLRVGLIRDEVYVADGE